MAVVAKDRKGRMILDYGKTHGKYTLSGINPDASTEDVYLLHQAVKSLQGSFAADIYFQIDSELVDE